MSAYRYAARIPRTATLAERAVAFAIDIVVLTLAYIMVLGGAYVAAGLPVAELAPAFEQDAVFFGLMYLPFLLAYFTLFEAGAGKTPGKAMTGLRIERLGGGRPSWLDVFVRNLLRLLWVPPGLGLVFLLVDLWSISRSEMEQRIGDLAADTIVVSDASA